MGGKICLCSRHESNSKCAILSASMAWREMEGRRLADGDPIADAVSRLRFAPASNNLLVSSWDSALRLYDADASVLRLDARSEAALLDCCFEGEAVALAGGSDGLLRRYDLHSGAQDIVGQHDDSVACVEFSQMTGQVVTASFGKKLMFWDMHARSVSPHSIKTLDSDVASLSVCNMYILAAVGTAVYCYDMRNLTGPVKAKDSPVEYHIRCLHASPGWKGYVTGSVDGCVALKYFDHSTNGDMGYVFRCHPKSRNGRSHLVPINDIAIHPCKNTFVTGDNEGYAIAWDAPTKKKLFEFPRYPGSVASISYNHCGQLLAVASSHNYQEVHEEVEPQIFIETVGNFKGASLSE